MFLVAGLGNPGSKYANTKHNFGFWVIDQFIQNRSLSFKSGRGDYIYAKNEDLIIAKPTTYMNNSGISIVSMCRYFNLLPAEVMIVYDDIDLPLGKIRFKPSGGAGGHNGIKSIISNVKSEKFNRLRLGIGTDAIMRPCEKYVLKPFNSKYDDELKIVINHACDALDFFLKNGIIESMNKFN